MPLRRALVIVVASILAFPSAAFASPRDFFDVNASGQAVYEDFAIKPELHVDVTAGAVVVVYQGFRFDPYAAVYDLKAGSWRGPYRIGDNPLVGDEHGAPAIIQDGRGFYHVFFGCHNSAMLHAVSTRPHDASKWSVIGPVLANSAGVSGMVREVVGTYPQASVDASGVVRLFYRNSGGLTADWLCVTSDDDCATWSSPEVVLDGVPGETGWYASFWTDANGDVHCVAALVDIETWRRDPFARQNAYYFRRVAAASQWTDAAGEALPSPLYKEVLDERCIAYRSNGGYVNQAIARVTADGVPVLLFVRSEAGDLSACRWTSVRWSRERGAWESPVTIAETDNLFDAGTLVVRSDGMIEAYLTANGYPDEMAPVWELRYSSRGGDIARWVSRDGGGSFSHDAALKLSRGPWERYNNPQAAVLPDGRTAVLFCEGNNDRTSSISKVFLWLGDGFARRELGATGVRLAGDDRYQTAVAVSQRSFPSHAATVVVATGESFADALCAAPLAASVRAPLLLTRKNRLDDAVKAEISRLGARQAIIVGGTGAVSDAVATQVRAALTKERRVIRIAGGDRYETACAVAREMSSVRGMPAGFAIATGENFPDALSAGALAARKNMPILLTKPDALPGQVRDLLASMTPRRVLLLGDEAVVSRTIAETVASLDPSPEVVRLGGPTRYDTAAAVARRALAEGLSAERVVVCTGEDYPDALAASVLAARANGIVLFTRRYALPETAVEILSERRPEIVEWHVAGGTGAVSPAVMSAIRRLVLGP